MLFYDELGANENSFGEEQENRSILHSAHSTPVISRSSTIKQRNKRISIADFNLGKFVHTLFDSGNETPRKVVVQNVSLPLFQYSHEKKFDDAIFKIYLKQIRTNSIEMHEFSRQRNDLSKNSIESTVEIAQLQAGTFEKVVECLTTEQGDLDVLHMHILFATYRTFSNTKSLIETMVYRYRQVTPASLEMSENVRLKTIRSLQTAIISLLNHYEEDFDDPPDYSLLKYLQNQIAETNIRDQCQKLLNHFLQEKHKDLKINNSSSSNDVDPIHFLQLSNATVAEQLTRIDADLFKRVLPHECLSSGSSRQRRRQIDPNRKLTTINKTQEFFNSVTNRVIGTVLNEENEQNRARVIEKWINVAENCRILRNYSSLTAILSGLLSQCVYRLKTAWSFVTLAHRSNLNELKNVFESCAERKQMKEILETQLEAIREFFKENPSISSDLITAIDEMFERNSSTTQKRFSQKNPQSTTLGTIPYLGIYLCDLTYTSSAGENYISMTKSDGQIVERLINFDKQRKYFEILARIKLFQSTVDSFGHFVPVPEFQQWFDRVRIYNEHEDWIRSCEIEPENLHQSSIETTIKCNKSLHSLPSMISIDELSLRSNRSSRDFSENVRLSHSSLSDSLSSSQEGLVCQASPSIHSSENEFILAKVHLQGNDSVLYKTVRINNNERVPTFLKRLLEKFGQDPSTYERFCLEQRLPNQQIVFSEQSNVFYALKRSPLDDDVELIVREKTRVQSRPMSNLQRTLSGFSRLSTQSH